MTNPNDVVRIRATEDQFQLAAGPRTLLFMLTRAPGLTIVKVRSAAWPAIQFPDAAIFTSEVRAVQWIVERIREDLLDGHLTSDEELLLCRRTGCWVLIARRVSPARRLVSGR